ncbi:Mbeg1-like protein [Campylobacter concisus]|uniref:Esterase/lipase n=1 Tax=Campylobacter concisus (strain 13826) TaxID=360104 RepID=A7ZBX5_CAMC1|nr:Mbeg1-like protein [Campylobacter concisus]EAT98194.1 putative esterase/lipase [Campylobacter concisus 13826]
MNTLKNLTNKDMVNKIKDYADIADVAYAFFEYIDENEIWSFSDKFYNEKILKTPNPRWDYADSTYHGHTLEKLNQKAKENGRQLGQPTAYALCVEARFMQDLTIEKPEKNDDGTIKKVKISNEIRNFITTPKGEPQRLFINEKGYHQISERTKKFTSRFRLLKHQKNDELGFSATLFEDTENNNKRILTFRGTEITLEDLNADIQLTRGKIPDQAISLIYFFMDYVLPILKEGEKINICGHSLGGYLTQACAFTFAEYIDEIYTFNSPGLLRDFLLSSYLTNKINSIDEILKMSFDEIMNSDDEYKELAKTRSDYKVNLSYQKTLYKNIFLANKDHTYLPAPLNVNNIYHMKTDNDSLAFNNKLYENAIQDLGVDINGNEVLINIGNVDAILNTNVSVSSHFLTYTAATLYFFSYLLEQKDNDEKTKNVSLKGTLLYLNDFMEQNYKLIFDLDTNLSLAYKNETSYIDNKATLPPLLYNKNKNWMLLILLNNIKHDFKILNHNLEDEQEALIIEDIFKLSDKKQYTKIISKDEVEKFKEGGCENIEDKRAMHKCRTYKVVDESSSDVTTTKADASKLYTYTSNFTRSLSSQDEKTYFMKKSEQTYSLLFDNSTQNGSINLYDVKDRGEIKFGFLSASSSVYVDKDKESLAIFTKDKDIVDIERLYDKIRDKFGVENPENYKVDLFLNATLLKGANEAKDYKFGFTNFKDEKEHDLFENKEEQKPFYYFSPRGDESSKGSLDITNKNTSIRVLGYDIERGSLDIKLKRANNDEKKENQMQSKEALDHQSIPLGATATNFTAHPVIEDDIITCPHGGRVVLKSKAGRSIKSQDIALILGRDFLGSPIVGCSANSPCTCVAHVPKSALSAKRVNEDYALMQDLVHHCLSDKGCTLSVAKKSNLLTFEGVKYLDANGNEVAPKEVQIKQNPRLRFFMKSAASQRDNMHVAIYSINGTEYKEPNGADEIVLKESDAKDVSDKALLKLFNENFKTTSQRKYEFKEYSLKYGADVFRLNFIKPEYKSKHGVNGYYERLSEYENDVRNLIFLTPNQTKDITIKIAKGLDAKIEKDAEITDVVVLQGL